MARLAELTERETTMAELLELPGLIEIQVSVESTQELVYHVAVAREIALITLWVN